MKEVGHNNTMVFAKCCALFRFLMGPTPITFGGNTKYEVNAGWVMKYEKHREKNYLAS